MIFRWTGRSGPTAGENAAAGRSRASGSGSFRTPIAHVFALLVGVATSGYAAHRVRQVADSALEEIEIQMNGLIQDGGAAIRRVVQTVGSIGTALVWLAALLIALRLGGFILTSGRVKTWIKKLFLRGGQNLEGNVENKQRAEALVARLRGRAALSLESGGYGARSLARTGAPPQMSKASVLPPGGRPPTALSPPSGSIAGEEQASVSPAPFTRVTLYKETPEGDIQVCLVRMKPGIWTTFELDGPGVPGACKAFAVAGGDLSPKEQEAMQLGSVRVGFDRQGVQTTFVATARPLVEVFGRWEARDRGVTKVAWFKPSELPDECDGNFARALDTAFGNLGDRRASRVPGCFEGFRRFGGRSSAAAAGSMPEARSPTSPRAAVGQPPGPLAVADEPILEIKGFPDALEGVVSTMSLAQRELVFTCYTVDHPRVLSAVQEKLREGVRVRVLVDGMVLKGETVKNGKAFFRALLGDSSPNLELGVFWAPRNRIKEKGAAGPTGHVKGFGPQLHAKCGTVDGLHFWTGSLNLTSNSETFYEMVSIGCFEAAFYFGRLVDVL